METSTSDLESALGVFGLDSFRPGQREVIEAIVAGDDCMCVMPTGGGKSLCYQLPSVVRPGLTIVVSPLIALMKDQVDGLARRGIPAALINSSLSPREQAERLQAVASGQVRMLYVAPERLRNSRFLDAIRATPIQLLAVDEAHCISQWGHDFRPDYARIGRFRELLGGVQTVALTATATPRVRDDIVHVLQLRKAKRFMSGFARPNLHFGVLQLNNDRDKEEQLETFLRQEAGAGIIYSATRKRCEHLVELISKKLKIPVGAYHAGLVPDQRRAIQERFMRGELRVVVATNAFGMGIDKADLRFVIHYNMPGSLEAYYQEAGRAGRDGLQSQCVMLYSLQDRHIQEFFIDNNYPESSLIQRVYEFLQEQDEDPIELTLEQIRDALGVSVSPEAIGSCLQILGRTNVLDRLEMGSGLAILKIDSQLPTLVDLLPREAKVQRSVLRLAERIVGDRRGEEVHVHPRWLLQESKLQRDALGRALRGLVKLEEFDYVPPFRGRAVHFRRRGVPYDQLGIDFENLRRLKEAEYDRLNQIARYAQTPRCRQATILNYFGDTSAGDCRRCDRCGRRPGWPDLKANRGTASATGSEESQLEEGTRAEQATEHPPALPRSVIAALEQALDAIGRVHGRLGKHLTAQYLCGSKNAKVQKLNLHRLSGFGLLAGFRQSDGVSLVDALLSAGALRQQEVNRNRPTVSVAPEMEDPATRQKILERLQLSAVICSKLKRLETTSQSTKPVATAAASETLHASDLKSRSRERTSTQTSAAEEQSRSAEEQRTEPRHEQHEQAEAHQQAGGHTGSRSEDVSSGRPHAAEQDFRDPHHLRSQSLATDIVEPHSSQPPNTPKTDTLGADTLGAGEPREATPRAMHGLGGARERPDWTWTILLFSRDFDWQQIMSIRRMQDEELAASLCLALRQGQPIERDWVTPTDGSLRTPGQQRVWREMRRRSSAGVGQT